MDARIEDLGDLLALAAKVINEENRCIYPIDVAVEDDNGECRLVTFAWYDEQRKMLRLTLEHTLFIDNEEE